MKFLVSILSVFFLLQAGITCSEVSGSFEIVQVSADFEPSSGATDDNESPCGTNSHCRIHCSHSVFLTSFLPVAPSAASELVDRGVSASIKDGIYFSIFRPPISA